MSATPAAPDPGALLRSREYVQLLVLAALAGVPISAAAYGFLYAADRLSHLAYSDLPDALGFASAPVWWPAPMLLVAGAITAATIRFLPGTGGHSPADGFKPAGALPPNQLPGVVLAALATLTFGVVLGPEAPLIMLGSGLGVLAVRLAAKDAPDRARAMIAAAGSFAAISSLLGSPLIGAFLLLEAAGLGGPMLGLVLLPGLLSAGIGALIFVGLDSLTGLGTFSLAVPGLPAIGPPTIAMFGWAVAIGLCAALAGSGIQRLALLLRRHVERRILALTPLVGLAVAGLAIAFAEITDHDATQVLFSGQSAIGGLLAHAGTWSLGALIALVLAKGVAYGLSMSAFRGGPVFPSILIGAAGGILASHGPGLDALPGAAMGMGAMATVMLRLPMTSALLPALVLGSAGTDAIPLVIVAVVVAHVATAHLTAPAPAESHPHRVMTEDDTARTVDPSAPREKAKV